MFWICDGWTLPTVAEVGVTCKEVHSDSSASSSWTKLIALLAKKQKQLLKKKSKEVHSDSITTSSWIKLIASAKCGIAQ